MEQNASEAYAIYQESLAALLKIPDVLSSKLEEIDHDEAAAAEQAKKASTTLEEWIASHSAELERELSVTREKLRFNNMSLPPQKAFNEPQVMPILADAIQQLKMAGMAIDRAIREAQKAREESARRAEEEKRRREEEERKRAEAHSKMLALIAERKRRTRNILITIAVGAILAVVLVSLTLWIPGFIVLAVTALAVIPQFVSCQKSKPSTTQASMD